MADIDYTTVVLTIESTDRDTEKALNDLPSNEEYRVEPVAEGVPLFTPASREGTPLITPSKALYAIHLTQKPFDPSNGWVFGSEENGCDFQLSTNNKGGVSGRHFRINFNWTSMRLVLTNLSQHHTMMSSPTLGKDIPVRDSRVLPFNEAIAVTAGLVCLSVQVPERGEHQRAFDRALDLYYDEARRAIPRLAGLTVSKPVAETPLVVLGKRNRGRYIIEEEGDIGSGAFGSVSKALDSITGNLYAAKRLTKMRPRGGTTVEEFDIHRKISHVGMFAACSEAWANVCKEHIVRVVDVQEDLRLLIMEYIPFGNLGQQQDFGLSETVVMFEQQLRAVEHLHMNGITHRDIKPENILVASRDPNLNTKLSDFGLSSERAQLRSCVGTPLYCAPEIRRLGGAAYSNAVDIWSLGAVGLELAYSFPKPLPGQDWSNAIHHHAGAQRGPFAALLRAMLQLRPSARPSAESCLACSSTWKPDSPSALLEDAQLEGNSKLAPVQIPIPSCIPAARHHQPTEAPEVGVKQVRPGDLFGAIASGEDPRTDTGIEVLSDLRMRLREYRGQAAEERQDTEERTLNVGNPAESAEEGAEEGTDVESSGSRPVAGAQEGESSGGRGTAPRHVAEAKSVRAASVDQAAGDVSSTDAVKSELLKWMETTPLFSVRGRPPTNRNAAYRKSAVPPARAPPPLPSLLRYGPHPLAGDRPVLKRSNPDRGRPGAPCQGIPAVGTYCHLTFLRRTSTGPATFRVKDVKLGRQTSTVHVTLTQGGSRDEVVGYVTHSNISLESGVTLPTHWEFHPAPYPADVKKLNDDTDPHWRRQAEMPFAAFRKASTNVQFYFPRKVQLDRSIADEWMHFNNGERFTMESLGYVADTFPQIVEAYRGDPSVQPADGRAWPKFWYPTLLLNLEIKKVLPPEGVEWLFVRVRAKQIKNGRMDLEVIILDAGGDLVALSQHVSLVVGAERNVAARGKGSSEEGDGKKEIVKEKTKL